MTDSTPTVENFTDGFFNLTSCECEHEALLASWGIEYTGQGAAQHAEIVLDYICENCGKTFILTSEIRFSWMLNHATDDVHQVWPSEDMENEFYDLLALGYAPSRWADVRALQLRLDEQVQLVGGAA